LRHVFSILQFNKTFGIKFTTAMEKLAVKSLVEVCYSPAQYHLYNEDDFDVVVVIDVLRATSAITTALHFGVAQIIPLETIDEAIAMRDSGIITAAEREGQVVDGFEFGNSPIAFMQQKLVGKTVALTTTNGTRAIRMAAQRPYVVMGCLNNLDILCHWLINMKKNVLLLASGWKEKYNLEDTICGGAIADTLLETGSFICNEDSTISAKFIYRSARQNLWSFLKASSHRRRLKNLNIQEDVRYCLQPNTVHCIPILKDGVIVKLPYQVEGLSSATSAIGKSGISL
jgi:2-phosphosulfolactate phosphatase